MPKKKKNFEAICKDRHGNFLQKISFDNEMDGLNWIEWLQENRKIVKLTARISMELVIEGNLPLA